MLCPHPAIGLYDPLLVVLIFSRMFLLHQGTIENIIFESDYMHTGWVKFSQLKLLDGRKLCGSDFKRFGRDRFVEYLVKDVEIYETSIFMKFYVNFSMSMSSLLDSICERASI